MYCCKSTENFEQDNQKVVHKASALGGIEFVSSYEAQLKIGEGESVSICTEAGCAEFFRDGPAVF